MFGSCLFEGPSLLGLGVVVVGGDGRGDGEDAGANIVRTCTATSDADGLLTGLGSQHFEINDHNSSDIAGDTGRGGRSPFIILVLTCKSAASWKGGRNV